MDIEPLLFSEQAKQIFSCLKQKWKDEELAEYGILIARYINELVFFHKVERQLAESETVLQTWQNNKSKSNAVKSELTRVRNESALLLCRYEKMLNLTPNKSKTGDDLKIEFPE